MTDLDRPAGIVLAPTVREALDRGRPVVALESSVLAQGLPIPANRDAEARMRAAIIGRGVLPAITAVVRGALTVGLDGDDLGRFLRRDGVAKVSSRDLAIVSARGGDGATTVAATLTLCRAAGLPVMATGGIGGVHRDAPYDESADLSELSRSPMVVICAGAKAILDLPATVERLESLGVTVLGYRTDEFPGFFTARTGLPVPARVDTVDEIVHVVRASRGLGHPGAILVVQAPPAAEALDPDLVDDAVTHALSEVRARGIRGAAVTPFLLSAVERRTGGRSLRTNLALLEANAALAADVAMALATAP